MNQNVITHDSLTNGACDGSPFLPLRYRYIHSILLWSILLLSCDKAKSFLRDENDASPSLRRDFLADTMQRRRLQSAPASSPLKGYAARRINAGGEIEYIDTNGVSWGADDWYGNKGRRTTPSECTANIINTTDDILYCSNRFYPTSIVDPPYRYNIPLPYPALYEVRLHFAEVIFESVGSRIFNILIEGEVAVENLDVYARAGALTAYVLATQVLVTDRIATIQFVPVVNNPFISAIEVVEVPNLTEPIATIPSKSPMLAPSLSPPSATYAEVHRINAGGVALVDSRGNMWGNDTFFQENSFVGDKACTSGRDILNTIDDALFCTERYFKGNNTIRSSYEIPVNYPTVYVVNLYFSENHFNKSGVRLFDVVVEGEAVFENFDVFESAGGPVTLYVISTVVNVTDGLLGVQFIPKVNFPTISAIEVLLVADNVTTTSPSASPTLDIGGQAVSECSAYPVCVNIGFTGSCCPLANGTSRECCFGIPQQSAAPYALSSVPSAVPSDILSSSPSIVPTIAMSFEPSVSVTSPVTTKPSLPYIAPSVQQAPVYEFNKTIKSVSGVMMVLSRNTQAIEEALASDTNCTVLWKDAIRNRIEDEVLAVIPMYETIDVNLFDVSRSSNLSFISITFDTVIEVRSAVQDVDANRFIKGPFDSQSEKNSFIQYLTSTPCPEFDNVGNIEIIIPNESKADEGDKSNNDEDERFFFGLFIAVGAGGVAILLAACLITSIRMRQRRKIDEIDCASITPANVKQHRIESTPEEIDRSHDGTDISTLGDPIIHEALVKKTDVDTSTVGSGGEEYDYKKAYLDLESTTESNIGESSAGEINIAIKHRQLLTYADDLQSINDIVSTTGESTNDMFIPETEYSVVAPPGLLGLILESSSVHGRPIVNSVKPFSVLANRVSVGDHLVSVDDEDVSAMTANEVSQLIASRQNEMRNLTFKRRIIDNSNGVC